MLSPLRFLAAIGAAAVMTSCASPESNLFNTGRDARVYNPQTGRYEWPDEPAARRTSAAPQRNGRLPNTPPPTPAAGDERTYDPQSRQFR